MTTDIISLLMVRDNISRAQAIEMVVDCKQQLNELFANGKDLSAAEDIIADTLGLEMDSLFDIL